MDNTEKEVLGLFTKELRRRLGGRIICILLYGSRARGDHGTDSDYDCLLILDDVSSDVMAVIDDINGEFLYQYNVVFSVLPKKEKELREHPYNPIFMNAFQEGIAL